MSEELENLSETDRKLARMLASLKQVEAPKDFGFRTKARIANANPRAYRTNYKRRFAFALTPAAFVVVSALVVINGNFSGADQASAPLSRQNALTVPAAVSPTEAATATPGAQQAAANEDFSGKTPESDLAAPFAQQKIKPIYVADKQPTANKNPVRKFSVRDEQTFTTEPALKSASVIVQPEFRGTPPPQPQQQNISPEVVNQQKGLSARDVISELGAELVTENGGWKVKSVKKGSPAERAGMKADDVIETLDGQKVSDEAESGKKITVKKIGVKRGSGQVEINLQSGSSGSQ